MVTEFTEVKCWIFPWFQFIVWKTNISASQQLKIPLADVELLVVCRQEEKNWKNLSPTPEKMIWQESARCSSSGAEPEALHSQGGVHSLAAAGYLLHTFPLSLHWSIHLCVCCTAASLVFVWYFCHMVLTFYLNCHNHFLMILLQQVKLHVSTLHDGKGNMCVDLVFPLCTSPILVRSKVTFQMLVVETIIVTILQAGMVRYCVISVVLSL